MTDLKTTHRAPTNRRWRRVVLAGGSIAALAVLGVTSGQAFAGEGGDAPISGQTSAAQPTPGATPDQGAQAPDGSGPATPQGSQSSDGGNEGGVPYPAEGTALESAVQGVASGSITDVQGSRSSGPDLPDVVGTLSLTASDGSPEGDVSVAWTPEAGYGGMQDPAKVKEWLLTCDATTTPDCKSVTLPDGSLVRETTEHMSLSGRTWEINSVERDVDGAVALVASYSPRDPQTGDVLGSTAPLSLDQLVKVASQLTPPGF